MLFTLNVGRKTGMLRSYVFVVMDCVIKLSSSCMLSFAEKKSEHRGRSFVFVLTYHHIAVDDTWKKFCESEFPFEASH